MPFTMFFEYFLWNKNKLVIKFIIVIIVYYDVGYYSIDFIRVIIM